MKPEDLPVVREVVRFGGNDRVLDALILLGPVVVCLVALVGRSPATTGLAAVYVLALPVYVFYKSRVT